jgi:UDP-2-acetamido-2,6-beta-L-arabino-hexul-4-ose reductase
MNVLVTGAKGFVGSNLCAQLKNIRDGKARNYPVKIDRVFEYDIDSTPEELEMYCKEADFIFNLAGVNRTDNSRDFCKGNLDFAYNLLEILKKHGNTCPVMLSSSIQASLEGRYAGHPYGESKKAAEELFFSYAAETGAKVLVYRFPNIFGKWCRPNYNSVVATFCYNIANDLPIHINDRTTELELLYIDDLIDEMMLALQGKEHHCEFDGIKAIDINDGKFCYVPKTFHVTLGDIVDLLYQFSSIPETLLIPEIPSDSFAKRLLSTYLSYLPKEKAIFDLKTNIDSRGSFTELIHTQRNGQVSINISKPGVTKGQHWHHSKWEKFIVVKGHGLIQMRKEGSAEIQEYEVGGDRISSVIMLPGYTHNIINLSDSEDLITVMYSNEIFDSNNPDTFYDPV